MFKKIMAILGSLALVASITGCTSSKKPVDEDNTPPVIEAVPLTDDQKYLVGTYNAKWDATELYGREYYKLDPNQEFVPPNSKFLIDLILEINEDGTYKLNTDDSKIPFAFDSFLNDDSVYTLEYNNYCNGNASAWSEFYNNRGLSYANVINNMKETFPESLFHIHDSNGLRINEDDTIDITYSFLTIETLNDDVRLTLTNKNSYTGNKTQFIKQR